MCISCKRPGRTGKLQHNLSYHWPCRSKVQRTVKEQNLITVHFHSLLPVFISHLKFRYQKKNTKNLSTWKIILLQYICQAVSYHHNICNFIQINILFHIIITKSLPWLNVTSLSRAKQKFKVLKTIFPNMCDKFMFLLL